MPDSKAVARVLATGYIFDAKAFDMINGLPAELDVDSFVDRLLALKAAGPSEARMITEEDVAKALPPGSASDGRKERAPVEEEVELEVVSDPTPAISPIEANEGFNRLFRDRYERLLGVVKGRPDMRGVSQMSEAKGLQQGKKARVAGLLASRANRRNNVEITLDDPSGTVRIVCQDDAVAKSALQAPLDSMVVVEVSRGRSGQLYANSLVLPDVPGKRPVGSSHRVYAVLLSDLHVGSRMFLLEDFKRFIQWINGGLGDVDVVSRVKYLVVAGDLVDGVGVYPGQEFQLAERDPKKQYEMAAELLKQVPPGIQMVISPGNHDAVRQALPQPAVGADMAESLYAMDNVRWVGDPCYVKLHGVTFLIYHGKSLDDVIATTPDLTYDNPTDAMKLLLRSRHLAPTYGKRTALSPELRDFMVVDPVPDVMHSGHVHTYGELTYRGTLMVNSGTFQGQTNFQVNMGLDPTPSIVPVIDLSTLKVMRRNFGAAGFVGA
ncbi:MAG TPA: DNA-directed DNA polymerase II small subunit [Nitrososphaerales archaeon]|nr:DNA-directed DNA polymerase II small subunit [Nitrososphaerales archaeon]